MTTTRLNARFYKVTKVSTCSNNSRGAATIKVVANFFHAELSDPDAQIRSEIIGTIRELNLAAQHRPRSSHLPEFFLQDDGKAEGAHSVEVTAAPTKTQRPEFDLIRL